MKYLLIATLFLSTLAIAVTVTLQPDSDRGKDAFIVDALPTQNFGNNADLRISGLSASTRYLTYIEFSDVDVYVGHGHSVTSADFELYLYNGTGTGTVNIFVVTGDWLEETITWNNIPSNQITPVITDAFDSTAGWKNYDLTATVQDWFDGTYDNYGLLIRGSSGESFTAYYRSSDYATENERPALIIESPTLDIEYASLGVIKTVFK